MVNSASAANKPLIRLGSWTPHGRAPRPYDMPAEALKRYKKFGKLRKKLFYGVLFIGFLALTFEKDTLSTFLSNNLLILQIIVLSLMIPRLIIVEYRQYCWAAQRLHDIGESSRRYVMRWLAAWMIPVVIAVAIAAITLFPDFEPDAPVVFGIAYVTLLIPGGFLLLIGVLWMQVHVQEPFDRYLHRTPGDPQSNRFGPPPT